MAMFCEEWYPLHGPKGTILSDPDRGLFILEENPVCKDTLQSASSHSLLTHKHTDTGFIHPTVRLNMRLYASFTLHTRTLINAQKVHAIPGIHMLMHTCTLHCSFLRSLRLALKYRRYKRSHQSLSPIENNRAARFRDPHHPQSLPIKITPTGALIEAEGNLLSSAITQCIFMFF